MSNDEIEDIIKIVTSLEDSGLLVKGVTEKFQSASLLGNILTDRGAIAKRKGRRINRAGDGAIATRQGKGIVRAGYGSHSSKKNGFLMLPHPLTNFEIKNYY